MLELFAHNKRRERHAVPLNTSFQHNKSEALVRHLAFVAVSIAVRSLQDGKLTVCTMHFPPAVRWRMARLDKRTVAASPSKMP